MEVKAYCRVCGEEHIVSETIDHDANVVGLFCNRKKAMIDVYTHEWNGENIYKEIEKFANQFVDKKALGRMKPEKIEGLSRKMAYLFLQTDYAKSRSINYYVAQYHMYDVIKHMAVR